MKYSLRPEKSEKSSKSDNKVCYMTGLAANLALGKLPGGKKQNRTKSGRFEMQPCLGCNNENTTDKDSVIHNVATFKVWRALHILY